MRQALEAIQNVEGQGAPGAVDFLRACGPRAVPVVIGLIPATNDTTRRRQLSDAALRIGITSIAPVRNLLDSSQAEVAREGIYMLAQIASEDSLHEVVAAQDHPNPSVRLALLSMVGQLS